MIAATDIRISTGLLIGAISVMFWTLLLMDDGSSSTDQHHTITMCGQLYESKQIWSLMSEVPSLLTSWTVMVIAMMLPKLIGPIQYIHQASFKHRRLPSSLLFMLGYLGVWISAGVPLLVVVLGLNFLISNSLFPLLLVTIVAVIWQFSPIKQRFMNIGHYHKTLGAFGWQVDRDALLFGVIHGCGCVGSGWALMLFPVLLPNVHMLAMVPVTYLMISEHLEHPKIPRWRINLSGKLLRIAYAQILTGFQRACFTKQT